MVERPDTLLPQSRPVFRFSGAELLGASAGLGLGVIIEAGNGCGAA